MIIEQAQKLIGEVVELTLQNEKAVGLLWFVGRNEFLDRLQINIGYSSPAIYEIENCDSLRQVTEEELECMDVNSFKQLQEQLKKKSFK